MQSAGPTRVDGGDLAYLHNGITDGTPVVFLHGFSDMAECWVGLMARLDLELPMYALDAPGHGHSTVEVGESYTPQIARRAAHFVAGLGRPVILMGHSMGALQAMHLAGDIPALVRAVVLEDPPLAQDLSPWADPQTLIRLGSWLLATQAQEQSATMARVRQSDPHWDEVEYEPWVRSKHLVNLDFIGGSFAIHREPMETTLTRIACPGLLLTGDPDRGAIVEPAAAAWAQALCPTLRVSHFPGTSHSVHRDAPGAVAEVVRTFILEQQ